MRLVEIRDLDGPNIFLLQPAIKCELEAGAGDLTSDAIATLAARLEPFAPSDDERAAGPDGLGDLLQAVCAALHERAGVAAPEMRWVAMESPGHWTLAFGWERRRFARELARLLAAAVCGENVDLRHAAAQLPALLAGDDQDDRPGMIRDEDRTIPVVAVTGTNGKTTTTRLVAHILRGTGRKVGWTSTLGVYIEGVNVLEGDYTGPAGAWRVMAEPGLDAAVLETARGGILLRGMACESNDVGVMTNITGDHLGLHGVRSVEGLAEVKAVVLRTTQADGWVVLNADDPLVRGQAAGLHASIIWVSQDPQNPTVVAHREAGGRAVGVQVAGARTSTGSPGWRRCPSPSAARRGTWWRTRSAPPAPHWHSAWSGRRPRQGCAPSAPTRKITSAASMSTISTGRRSFSTTPTTKWDSNTSYISRAGIKATTAA
jgi:cyanophycin synthetase